MPLERVKRDLQKKPPGGVDAEPDDHGLGRSRSGLTTKLHLAVEQGQKPLSLLVTAGRRHNSPQFQPVLDGIRVPRTGPGCPRTKPKSASSVLDEYQHVQPFEQDCLHDQEVARIDRVSLGGEELPARRASTPGCGVHSIPAACRISRTVEAAIV